MAKMAKKDPQSRKFLLTINNPDKHGLDRERVLELCKQLQPDYCCLSKEIGESGTPHIHVFLYRRSPMRFSSIKKKFETAHVDQAYGLCSENRDYVAKGGKWETSEKAETSVPGSFAEFGDLPEETKASTKTKATMEDLLEEVKDGKSTARIITQNPAYAFRIKDIDAVRQTLLSEKFMVENREIEVAYIYGAPGTGKTRSIFEAHGAENICRVTNYRMGKGVSFDAYHGQDVLVFEEFNGQIQIEEMLNYLDRYPLLLPARYSDRVACFTKVYLTSNVPLENQYEDIQIVHPATWKAFLRRIHRVVYFDGEQVQEMSMDEWKEERNNHVDL